MEFKIFVIAKKIFEEGLKNILVSSDYFLGKYIKNKLLDPSTQETFLKSGASILLEDLDKLIELNVHTLVIADIDPINKGSYLIDTLKYLKKKNILILEGGYNEEHEVSLSTAKEVKKAVIELIEAGEPKCP